MDRIIYPNAEGGIALITPTGVLAIEEVARKDVPSGVPYRFVNSSDLPEDHTFFNAWTADFSNPDGYGIGAEAWFAEQAAKETQE
jgi:hypothetical protein